MKLYFSLGACSLSPHIVALEAGIPVDIVKVDLKSKKYAGGDYSQVNPKGSVPALQLDDGQVLTEGPAIVQYLADQKPASNLAPKPGSIERYRVMEWLNFITSEIHKTFSPLFRPDTPAETKATNIATLGKKFEYLAAHLNGKSYLMGETFTVPDAYLFTLLGWAKHFDIDLGQWPALKQYFERVGARPKVKEAIAAEKAA